jgi:hypothetical protein
MFAARVRISIALGLVCLVAACGSDQGPIEPAITQVAGAESQEQLRQPSLQRQEEREKARVALEQERSKVAYDSLKSIWGEYADRFGNGGSPLLVCDPLQYAATVKIVGPEGADLDVGPHKLRIPRGALARATVITFEQPVSLEVTTRLSPHGITFGRPVTLTLSYKHCLRPTGYRERVAYTDEQLNILEYVPSRDNDADGLVSAVLDHFSRYAVAW